jgi:hypothetical protein
MDSHDTGRPLTRPLKAFAFDPSQGRLLGNQMSMAVRYEDVDAGPVVRDRMAPDAIAVVDYDATNDVYYHPVDLDDPRVLIRGGLEPNEADPRFHQQMVYAVATDTIQSFETALGRRIHWRRTHSETDDPADADDIYTLNLYPHAMMMANAFYSPAAHGILFGYFRADMVDQGRNLPGQTVFTCLSHDVVVHELTHAIVDGIRGYFMEQTNPDVAAFHEAFADVVALFRHFSHTEVLLDAIQRTGGNLFEAQLAAPTPLTPGATPSITAQLPGRNPLVDLAMQFGEATGRGQGLRSALETPPNSDDMSDKLDPHARGSILVSAIFDAFFTIYVNQTADLFRAYRSGGAGPPGAALPDSLTRLLAEKASSTANLFFKVCVRALDYCPPVDITFGDFLRAVITSDFDLHPTDDLGLRDAFMQACRSRGIVPEGSAFFSDVAIAWPQQPDGLEVAGLAFGDPNGLTRAQRDACKPALVALLTEHRESLGFADGLELDVASFHPVFRVNEDGSLRTDMVVEVVQQHPDEGAPRGGATIIISKPPLRAIQRREAEHRPIDYGEVRYVIAKHLTAEAAASSDVPRRTTFRAPRPDHDTGPAQVDFAAIHGAAR